MVACNNKQCSTTPSEEDASPTAALDSVLLTATIDAKERRDVAAIDIPNAFVQTLIEDDADMTKSCPCVASLLKYSSRVRQKSTPSMSPSMVKVRPSFM